MKALEMCVKGLTSKEVTTEYVVDEETGKMKAVKQKVNEKTIPPNIDLLKLLYSNSNQPKDDYEKIAPYLRESLEYKFKNGIFSMSKFPINWSVVLISATGSIVASLIPCLF